MDTTDIISEVARLKSTPGVQDVSFCVGSYGGWSGFVYPEQGVFRSVHGHATFEAAKRALEVEITKLAAADIEVASWFAQPPVMLAAE